MKSEHSPTGHYRRLFIMTALHFVAMYVLMYAMVDTLDNVQHSFNQIYMAGLMTASMLLIELPLMASMYPNRRYNIGIFAAGILLLGGTFLAIRQQAAISDRQFLRSMIPHHAGAILMCGKAPVRDPEIQELCRNIIASQQSEIDWMNAKLQRMQD